MSLVLPACGWLHARAEVTSLLKEELGVDPPPDTPLRELRNLAASKVGTERARLHSMTIFTVTVSLSGDRIKQSV